MADTLMPSRSYRHSISHAQCDTARKKVYRTIISIILLAWIFLFKETNFSVVIDSLSQKGIHISDYCPKMPFCEEGTHVMCMYYNPKSVMGPRCSNPQNITVTSDMALTLLEVSNAIRGKLAMGLEKGKGGVDLPRAYGMFKLHWDNELATFAQVLANQCVLRHDICRATKRFPDPGQASGMMRFSYDKWIPISKSRGKNSSVAGFTLGKVMSSITGVLKSWYSLKNLVTPAMIIDYPDWNLMPKLQSARLFLAMIHAPATHMGCGISAYETYTYVEKLDSRVIFHTIQVICNFSHAPKKQKPVYDLEPGPHTSRCGCPINAVEDEHCLCIYTEKKDDLKEELNCDGVNCEQPVILLPIFTVEDAPPSKLIEAPGLIQEKSVRQRNRRPSFLGATNSLELTDDDFHTNHSIRGDNTIRQPREQMMLPNHYKKSRVPNRHQQRKTSIFSRTVLMNPKRNNLLKSSQKDYKKDVIPRKDFSKAKHLLNNYVESLKNYTDYSYRPEIIQSKDKKSKSYLRRSDGQEMYIVDRDDTDIIHPTHTDFNDNDNEMEYLEHDRNDLDHNVIRNDDLGRYKIRHNGISHAALGHDENVHNTNLNPDTGQEEISRKEIQYNDMQEEDRDSKLMSLLDKLEEEVQHIELTGNKKQLFDAKIRKIYGSVVGKSSGLTTPTSKLNIAALEGIGNGANKKLDINNAVRYENDHDTIPELAQTRSHNHEEYDHDNMYKKVLEKRINDKVANTEVGKTIDDIINSNVGEVNDIVPKGRMRLKARINTGYNYNRDGNTEYDFRENPKSSRKDELLSNYRSSDSNYKSHRYPEYRKYYKTKNQGPSNEDYKLIRSTIDDQRNNKRLKYRDYYKNREGNSIESRNKNYFRRHQTKNEDWNIDDDVLSPERRKFYQERLENLERQLQSTRTRKYRTEEERHRRTMPVQTFPEETPRRPSKNRLDHFDMRERSRFLHGY